MKLRCQIERFSLPGLKASGVRPRKQQPAAKSITVLTAALAVALSFSLPPVVASASTDVTAEFDVLRTANNPGYYFSGASIDVGTVLNADDVDKDTFSAKARVTEANGTMQGAFGNFAWDPAMEDRALEDN
jgi:hypothetical protein